MLSADDVIRLLDLKPHPEGGHYRETFRDVPTRESSRAASTAIYFLLKRGERSHWHAGSPLKLRINSGSATNTLRLGPDLAAGERPQAVVPAYAWQAAEATGDWTLVGCTVAPGFQFEGFELAPKGWSP